MMNELNEVEIFKNYFQKMSRRDKMNEEEAIKIIDESWLFTTNHVLDDENKKFKMAIKTVLNMLEKDRRKLKIKDEYMKLALDLMFDYDGYYNKETKRGDIEGLVELIDETVECLKFALDCNDKKDIYSGGNKKFNILFEEIKEDSK